MSEIASGSQPDSEQNETVGRDENVIVRLYTLTALFAAAGAVTFVFQSEYAALLCPIVVLLVPLISLLLWMFRKIRGIVYSAKSQRYIRKFRIVLITGWCVSFLPGSFWGAILFSIYEPWPFSLKQGPDTAYAREGFTKLIGDGLADEVNEIYYKGYEMRDYDGYLRFRSCGKTVETQVIGDLELDTDDARIPSFHLNERLSWWFTAAEAETFEHWKSDFKEVWIDRATCTYYVRNWTF